VKNNASFAIIFFRYSFKDRYYVFTLKESDHSVKISISSIVK